MPTILTIGPQPLSAQSLSNSRLITNSSSFTLSGLVINLDITSTSSYPTSGSTINDTSGNGFTATIYNSPTYDASDFNNTCLNMNGSNQYITTSNIANRYTSTANLPESKFVWFYPTSQGQIITELGQLAINTGWHDAHIEVDSSGRFYFSQWQPGYTGKIISNTFPLSSWYYVGTTYNGSVFTAYINGVSIGNISITRNNPITNGTGQLHYTICAADSTNQGGPPTAFAGGKFKMFHTYNRALTPSEVYSNYTSTIFRVVAGVQPRLISMASIVINPGC
jgi:hypothetical protein